MPSLWIANRIKSTMTTQFTCDLSVKPDDMPHFWETCVGSGHATLALRADWQTHLAQCRRDLGFRHVRFHGMLDDDMGTAICQDDELVYSFHNLDRIYDFLRSIDMRPFVELSFMPTALSSGKKTTFHYQANVTPPKDFGQWAALVSKLASHLVERYGAKEVALWPIEVWNEPNMKGFWTGSKEDYFHLFETTHHALKHVYADLQVGGPVTAQNAWIDDFIALCEKANVPPDFISTHTYPTDAFGKPDDDTKKALSKSHLGILRERAQAVREQSGQRPLYYTEWSTSSNPRDELHDDPYAAAYITQTLLNMGSLVDGYSYWTFSDIFEENAFPTKPFQGGFGLMNIHGIPKPAYRAYEILHALGHQKWQVDGRHDTVQMWVTRSEEALTIVVVNLALPMHPVKSEHVRIELFNAPAVGEARLRRIDAEHANPKQTWKIQGEPLYPDHDEVQAMIEASQLRYERIEIEQNGSTCTFEVTVAPQSVTAIELPLRTAPEKAHTKPVQAPPLADGDPAFTALVDRLQKDAFRYFIENANPTNGLIADSSKKGSAASIAAVGFALSCYPVAVERGWLTRDQAADISRKTLRFFAQSRQGADAHATGYKGFYYHFLDMKSGERAEACELSTIDTSMLLAGAAVSAAYFDRDGELEQGIRDDAKLMTDRVDWAWTLDKNGEVNQSWKPRQGFRKADWDGYNEALTMFALGAASASHPLPAKAYKKQAASYQWHHNAGMGWLHATPLFIHLFPQAWLDLRGLKDGFIDKHDDLDYFENTCRAIAVQRQYALLNPGNYLCYGDNVWGLSACKGPEGKLKKRDGGTQAFLGYAARGVTSGPDDGTLVPWAAAACLAHAPDLGMASLRHMLATYPRVLRKGQFVGAFNPSLPGRGPEGWIAPACYGIDQGLVVMMIENARSGLIWNLTKQTPVFVNGLRRLGFSGGWLS